MNKNKKIATILTIVALAFAFTAIFMGFANGLKQEVYVDGKLQGDPGYLKFFDWIFNKDHVISDGIGKSSAGVIIAFVLTIISVITLAATAALNLTGKANQKLNKSLMITSAVVLMVVALMMVLAKGICVIPDEDKVEVLGTTRIIKNKLQAGPICWAAFTFVGGVSMIVAAVQNKKAA